MDEMFNPAILERPPAAVAEELRQNGYVILPEALTHSFVDRINREIGDLRPAWNTNALSPVLYKNQRHFSHCLAESRAIFDLMVRSWCFDVLKAYFGEGFRLTDQRVYVTEKDEHMQWHVDNKFDNSVQSDYPGLIFIFYLCDVEDGELQLVHGSHRWAGEQAMADFEDSFIEEQHGGDILSLKMPAGSGVVYDTSVVHRAHPIRRKGYERKSLFFQTERKARGGSPILVNTAFAEDLTADQRYFLGFGAAPEYFTFPQSSLKTIRPGRLSEALGQFAGELPRATAASRVWAMPADLRARLKGAHSMSQMLSVLMMALFG